MKLFLALITLVSLKAEALILNLDADIRVKPGTRGCRMEEKLLQTEFRYYEDPDNRFADWVGIVQIKPKVRRPELIPPGGFDLSRAKDVIFPAQEPPNCEFKATMGKISGQESDEITLLFRGKGCKPMIDIFANNQFSELGIEWSAISIGDGSSRLDGLTLTIFNPCKE